MIDSAAFIKRLHQTKPLSLKLSDALSEGVRVNRFDAQEVFLSPGNYANSIYFIHSGIVRGAIEGSAEKMTIWFKKEGDLILPAGLFTHAPHEEYVSVVTKTTALTLSFTFIQQLSERFPELVQLFLLLYGEMIRQFQYREKLLRIPAARDRYDFLAKHEDFILKRIPHYMVASYLNVTRETFSRLNKGLPY